LTFADGLGCVVVNTFESAIITFDKVCEGEVEGPFFIDIFEVGADQPTVSRLIDCGAEEVVSLVAGSYLIFEGAEGVTTEVGDGVDDDCVGGEEGVGVIVVELGLQYLCTITNTEIVEEPEADPELTIVKSCTGDEFDDASFAVSLGTELVNEPITCEGIDSQIALSVPAGDYVLSELISGADSGNFEVMISCVEGGVVTNTPGNAAALTLEPGDVVVCIITNQHDDPTDGEDLPPPGGLPGGNENDNTNVNTNINDINIGIDNSLTNDNVLTNENSLVNDNINTNENNQEQINDNNQVIEVNASPIVTVGD
jgi:hypothetical protein